MTPQGRGSGPTSAAEATDGGTLPLRGAISEGGAGLLTTLLLLAVIDEFPRTAAIVLAPDIQRAFGLSDTAVLGMIGLVGVALVLTTLPAASLGDRLRRTRVVSAGTFVLAACCALVGIVGNAFLMGVALTGTGVGVGSRMPNASSLIADGYPLRARARVFAIEGAGRPIGQLAGPLFAGAVAAAIGGPDAWRWVFVLIAVPVGALAVAALFLRDPRAASSSSGRSWARCSPPTRATPPSRCRPPSRAQEGPQLLPDGRGHRRLGVRAGERAEPDLAHAGGRVRVLGRARAAGCWRSHGRAPSWPCRSRGRTASGASPRTRPTCSNWSARCWSPTARASSSPSSSTPSPVSSASTPWPTPRRPRRSC